MDLRLAAATTLALSTLAACVDDPAPPPIVITPTPAEVATCRTQAFTADVDPVTWSVAGGGAIDAAGVYQAPIQVPASGVATVTATADGRHTDVAVTLATAFPGRITDLGGAATASLVVPDTARAIAARGARVYALVQNNPAHLTGSFVVDVVRSDDGGATWTDPSVGPIATHGGPAPLIGTSIAIDAGAADTVYVVLRVDGGGPGTREIVDVGTDQSASFLALATSTDGGAHFTTRPLYAGGNGDVAEADVASPAPGAVVVVAPIPWLDTATGAQGGGALLWYDDHGGATLAAPTLGDNGYGAEWATATELRNGDGDVVETNSHGHGLALTTNGAGAVCLTYAKPSQRVDQVEVRVRCSTDAGRGWRGDVTVGAGTGDQVERPRIALSDDGQQVAVMWNTEPGGTEPAKNYVALSTDGGASFAAARALPPVVDALGAVVSTQWIDPSWDADDVLWIARHTTATAQTIVDKSCDGGATWSGAVVIDAGERALIEPVLVTTSAGVFLSGVHADAAPAMTTRPALLRLLAL